VVEIRVRNWLAFFEDRTFCRLLIVIPLKMYSKIEPNVEIGQKIANGQLLFLALINFVDQQIEGLASDHPNL